MTDWHQYGSCTKQISFIIFLQDIIKFNKFYCTQTSTVLFCVNWFLMYHFFCAYRVKIRTRHDCKALNKRLHWFVHLRGFQFFNLQFLFTCIFTIFLDETLIFCYLIIFLLQTLYNIILLRWKIQLRKHKLN